MSEEHTLRTAERWFRLLLRWYPPDFREEMGDAVVETYRDRARDALHRGGRVGVLLVEARAQHRRSSLVDLGRCAGEAATIPQSGT